MLKFLIKFFIKGSENVKNTKVIFIDDFNNVKC